MAMPPHGRSFWDGETNLPPIGEERSLITGEKLAPQVTPGAVILPWCETVGGGVVGRGGIVIDVEPDPETGETTYLVLSHTVDRGITRAWTTSIPASEVPPTSVIPDSDVARHSYALAAWRAASEGRFASMSDMRLVDIGVQLVKECIR